MWGLPKIDVSEVELSNAPNEMERSAKRPKIITTSLDNDPKDHDKPGTLLRKLEWARSSRCFLLVVDCQLLAETVNGRIELLTQELESCLVDTLSNAEGLLEDGLASEWALDGSCEMDPAPRAITM